MVDDGWWSGVLCWIPSLWDLIRGCGWLWVGGGGDAIKKSTVYEVE